jgi:hypothetical protein
MQPVRLGRRGIEHLVHHLHLDEVVAGPDRAELVVAALLGPHGDRRRI